MRVRLLLDDINTAGLDPTLAALDAHPNIEVRLFNPFASRDARVARLPDRLRAREPAHAQQVVHRRQPGRRSSAGATSATSTSAPAATSLFADLDVLAIGPVVRDVSRSSTATGTARRPTRRRRFVAPATPRPTPSVTARGGADRAEPEADAYLSALRATPLVRDLLAAACRSSGRPRRVVTTIRRRRSTLASDRRAAAGRASRRHDRPAGEDARPRLALLRARRRRHRRSSRRWPSAASRCAS